MKFVFLLTALLPWLFYVMFAGDFSIVSCKVCELSGGNPSSSSARGDVSDSGCGDSENHISKFKGFSHTEMVAADTRRTLEAQTTGSREPSDPILLPKATQILKSALTPEIEVKMNQLIDQ